MERSSREGGVLWGLTFAHLALIAGYWPRLPERVASHFGPSGAPDAWSSRTGFCLGLGLFAFAMTGVFLVSANVTRWTSDDWINLPNKSYWLAPERRETTLEKIRDHVLQMGITTQLLLLMVLGLVLRANATATYRLGSAVWIGLALYLLILGGQVVAMVRDFSRPLVTP